MRFDGFPTPLYPRSQAKPVTDVRFGQSDAERLGLTELVATDYRLPAWKPVTGTQPGTPALPVDH